MIQKAPKLTDKHSFVVMAALFGLPLLAAFWVYYGSGWRPSGHTNNGELIGPAVLSDLGPPAAAFHGKWSLVVVGGAPGCGHTLWYARQSWLSMGKLAERIQRVLLDAPGGCTDGPSPSDDPGLVRIPADGTDTAALLNAFPAEHRERMIFIVDPLGNLMMRYDSNQDPKGLRQDLQRLLDLSHIG